MNYQKLEELIELQKLDEMDKITTDLRETFKDNYEVTITEGMGVARISFGDSLLFDVGSASMKKEASGLMGRLAESLREAPFTIVVEGHTDSIPLKKNAAYKNNWDLSLSRSMSIVNLLIAEHGMTPNQLAAAAYGENKPIAGNETEIGRRRNRRVEIALFKNFPLNREVNNER